MHHVVSIIMTAAVLALCACPGPSTNAGVVPGSEQPRSEEADAGRLDVPDPTKIYGYGAGDPTLPHVRGKGWYCYDVAHSNTRETFCHRTEKDCSLNRDQVLTREDATATECRFHPGKAGCLLVTLVRDGTEGHLCTPKLAECERFRMESRAARDTYLFVSQCEYIE